ncbi:hypothetical protein RB160 [Rhodopirellula baltica SH 1]|uniref:Uncharacterized protein n=1 Tax=Rhodopirellula baltica (strain DSM 10527 / NCIMB 13988 / SH1) TaxID=243090 RepID=Q7UZ65_RHOBA|nr:hypothetical protein RB160 [Rhodopirellula baltica SH 1]
MEVLEAFIKCGPKGAVSKRAVSRTFQKHASRYDAQRGPAPIDGDCFLPPERPERLCRSHRSRKPRQQKPLFDDSRIAFLDSTFTR